MNSQHFSDRNLLAKALENLKCGIIKVDQNKAVIYANQPMLDLMGVHNWQGLNLEDLLPDPENYQIIQEQIIKRLTEQTANEYDIEITRLDDGRKIPVSVVAIPEFDSKGHVIGSLGIVRDRAIEQAKKEIHQVIERYRDGQAMLKAVAEVLATVVPFDRFCVNVYSRDYKQVREFFAYSLKASTSHKKRWYKLSAPTSFVESKTIEIFNIDRVFSQPEWTEWREQPEVKSFLQQNYCYTLRRPIVRQGKVIASVYLDVRSERAFSQKQREVVEDLPLTEAVLMALHYEEKDKLQFRLQLIQKILDTCHNLSRLAKVITTEIADYYHCEFAAIFLVNNQHQKFELLSQHSLTPDKFKLREHYTQPLEQGLLGHVYRTKQSINIGNVKTSTQFKDIYVKGHPDACSEACLPIIINQIGWLLCLESSKEEAFATEEIEELQDLLNEVGILIEHAAEHRLLVEILRSATDAIITTDNEGTVLKANPATERLLGYTEDSMKGTPFQQYWQNQTVADVALHSEFLVNEEVLLQHQASRPVSVLLSGASLSPAVGGGKVYIASDLSLRTRVEELEVLRDAYHEIAVQIKTPLSLITSWLRRLKTSSITDTDLLDKTLQQLHRIEATFDRLLIYEHKGRLLPYSPKYLDIPEIIAALKEEMPEIEASHIELNNGLESPAFVLADLYQISFCFETILSYLLRFVPENGTICVNINKRTDRKNDWLVILMEGYKPLLKTRKGIPVRWSQGGKLKADWIKEFTLGRATLQRMIQHDNRGKFTISEKPESRIEIKIELPITSVM
jgi:PAS domain S-box-containing protein